MDWKGICHNQGKLQEAILKLGIESEKILVCVRMCEE